MYYLHSIISAGYPSKFCAPRSAMSATEIPCVPPLLIMPGFMPCLARTRAGTSNDVPLCREVLDFQVLQSLSNMSMYPVGMGCHPLLYPPCCSFLLSFSRCGKLFAISS